MKIFAATDLRGGRTVRLLRGDYDKETVYGEDPARTAAEFASAGLKYLHVVDLDGAREGRPVNAECAARVFSAFGGFCEIGGGIRDMAAADGYFAAGASRVILGTAALRDPDFLAAALKKYGSRIAVGVDARNGMAAADGWLSGSGTDAFDFCEKLAGRGVKNIIFTDISRDGTLGGTDAELYRRLAAIPGISVTASGGVTSAADIGALARAGCDAAIVGRAFYTGALGTEAALAAGGEQ